MMFLALMSKWMRPKQGLFCHGEGLSQQQQDPAGCWKTRRCHKDKKAQSRTKPVIVMVYTFVLLRVFAPLWLFSTLPGAATNFTNLSTKSLWRCV